MSQRTPEPRPRRQGAKTGRRTTDVVPREAWDLLIERFDQQDDAMELHRRDMGHRLGEIRTDLTAVKEQTTKTNGRVTKLEVDKQVRDQVAEAADQRQVRRTDRLRWWYGGLLAAASTVLGGILANAVHIHF